MSAAFTNIGSGYSLLPAAVTASAYRAKCQAMKISSPAGPGPNTSDHVPVAFPPASRQIARSSGASSSR